MKLSELLKSKNTNLLEISKACNIPYATLHNGINNPNKMNLENFNKIGNYLDISKDDLFKYLVEENKITLLSILRDQKDSKLKGNLYYFTQVKFAYNTNRIEGSKLSEDVTRLIFETNRIGENLQGLDVDDIIETSNSFYLFDLMLDEADKLISENLIKKYHFILKNGTSDSRKDWFNVGEYKKLPNEVGGVDTTSPNKVSKEMGILINWYNSLDTIEFEDIIKFHFRFESIHPFQDGNGRIGRLIMFRECLRINIVPFIIEDSKKSFYYRGLSKFKEEKGYLIDTCLSMQDIYKLSIKKYLGDHYNIKKILVK